MGNEIVGQSEGEVHKFFGVEEDSLFRISAVSHSFNIYRLFSSLWENMETNRTNKLALNAVPRLGEETTIQRLVSFGLTILEDSK